MSMKCIRRLGVGLVVVMVLGCMAGAAMAEQSVASKIRQMTGARTKIAWIRASGGKGHPFGPGMNVEPNIWRIVVIDTDENGGQERYLTEKPGAYHHIEITPSGKRVLWSGGDLNKGGEIWISDWDGTNQKKLLDQGCTAAVAEDPPGTEWVYVKEAENSNKIQPVYRYQIDDLTKKELVWDKNNTNDKWEVSRDGKYAVTRWNAGPVGICALPNGDPKLVSGGGCTPGMAPDLSLVTHMRPQGHSGIYVYNRDGSNERYIDFASQAPGAKDVPLPQFWWCNFARYDKRFYSFIGPHTSMTYNPNGSNIYLCRFNEKFDNFDQWIVVTDNPEMDTHSYVWIDSGKAPSPAEGLQIDTVLDSQMGATLKEPMVVTIKNNTDKDWKGLAKLTLEESLKAEKPDGEPISVAKGATGTVTLMIIKDPELNKGKFRKLPADVLVADAQGRVIDWSRKWFKVGCPVALSMAVPKTFDEARQPVSVLVGNITNKPVSGKIRLELQGPSKVGPIEQDFGPIPGSREVTVDVMVPNFKLPGYNWQATFTAQANGLETSLASTLMIDRRWLLLGPLPNFTDDPHGGGPFKSYDVDFGPEKELAGGIDITKTCPLPSDTARPKWDGWGALVKQWDDYLKAGVPLKWTPSPAIRAIPGGPHVEHLGYLNLYDYYQDEAKVPNQMAVTYCLTYVKSPDIRKAIMHTGQAGWMRVWINGKEALADKQQRGATPGTVKTEVELKAGWNEVVLKQGSAFFGYGYYFDFCTADGKTMSDLYYSLDKK